MTTYDPTFLDVEDDEQRQKRIGTLLEQLNTTSSSSSAGPLLNVRHEHSSPGPIIPPAELLARVQAFLPAISTSNEALSQQNPKDIDIENVAEEEEQYIEMNLGLGVFETKHRPESGSRSPSPSDAESTSDVTSSESTSDSSSSSSSSEEDSDSELDFDSASNDDSDSESQSGSSVDMKPISSRPIKPLPRRVSQQAKLEV